jgi:Ca-activated chloride channel family protein
MRKTVRNGNLPVPEEVRMEEFINYFNYNYKAPENKAFAVYSEGAPSLFNEGYHLLKVGLKAAEVTKESRKPLSLTFVVDCSGSMSSSNRLPLVKKSLDALVKRLNEDDKVALVAYGSCAQTVLNHTSVKSRNEILAAIENMETRGSTNADHGINLGYDVATEGYDKDYVNRVIVCSDGVANMGRTKSGEILESVKERAALGIYMTTLGFGMGNFNDKLMEDLADKGNGFYAYIDDLKEAEKLIESQITGGLQVAALDAKIQVKFDRSIVEMYRLVGYENRAVADKDFKNDKVDAGEISCGHSVTAVYEIKLTQAAIDHELSGEELGKVQVRYASPETKEVFELSETIDGKVIRRTFDDASDSTQLAFVVANYGEILRESYFARGHSIKELLPKVKIVSRGEDLNDEVLELEELMIQADRNLSAGATD